MTDREVLQLTGEPLGVIDVEAVARHGRKVALHPSGYERLARSRATLEAALESGEALYGVNTGFGSLARVRISSDDLREVQRNLILSHASGVGALLPDDVVRAMLLLLAASLTR